MGVGVAGKGTRPSRRRPWQGVAATEKAELWGDGGGIGRSVTEECVLRHEAGRDVTKSPWSSRFRAPSTTPRATAEHFWSHGDQNPSAVAPTLQTRDGTHEEA